MMTRTMGSSFRSTALSAFFALVLLGLAIGANAQINYLCNSTATAPAGTIVACPGGDGDALGANGLTITVTVKDQTNTPIVGMPATDIWLVGCDNLLVLCGGNAAINASAPTDANGQTTITGDIPAGGCSVTGVRVVVQGIVLGVGAPCPAPCVPVKVKSPDLDGDLDIDIVDFAMFGTGYPSPAKAYTDCLDFVVPFGTINIADFAKFGSHYNHQC